MYIFNTALSSADLREAPNGSTPSPHNRETTLTQAQLERIHRYWLAANYLCVGQIYLQDNPLLREPLRAEHIKPRLLGHWGTSAGQNFIYAHLNHLVAGRARHDGRQQGFEHAADLEGAAKHGPVGERDGSEVRHSS